MQVHERDRMQDMASREAETMGTHWSEKSLEDIKERDWRIFREEFDTTLKGERTLHPLRKWNEAVDLLPAAVFKAIYEMGFERLSPIQMQAITIGLQKRDIIGIAETVTKALHVTLKLQKDGKSESQVRVALVAADCASSLRARSIVWQGRRRCARGAADVEAMAARGDLLESCRVYEFMHVRTAELDVLEEILDLPEPDVPSPHLGDPTVVHALGVVRNFVDKMETLLTALQRLCTDARVARAFASTHFCTPSEGYVYASQGLVNVCRSDTAMVAATRACLLLSLDWSEAMPRTKEAQRRLGFFMKSLVMDLPSLGSIKEMRSFSVVTPFYAETVLFSLQELNGPLVNHPIFQHVERRKTR
ncbi:hypothetical protein PsorP6_007204 [Peronosclerospora sorghi]|uniref:Uncharacterized protein n=1 Tax=Peronosclerospora sorghi TaxID=230839 RepID=A0ACC0W779_9STRA|nr:hypothetical protein PsorP6_007204 [Peronosclerospora sorghi]